MLPKFIYKRNPEEAIKCEVVCMRVLSKKGSHFRCSQYVDIFYIAVSGQIYETTFYYKLFTFTKKNYLLLANANKITLCTVHKVGCLHLLLTSEACVVVCFCQLPMVIVTAVSDSSQHHTSESAISPPNICAIFI